MNNININKSRSIFECQKCGNCCKGGFSINIHPYDVKKWILNKRTDIAHYIEIDPKCISEKGLIGYHIEERNAILRLEQKYPDNWREKVEQLKEFIIEKHYYLGENIYPLPIYTIIPEAGRNPIFIAKSFITIRDGWIKWGLTYRISFGKSIKCPFLKDNSCTIHSLKPYECATFPFKEDGKLRSDEYALKICKGLKIAKKNKN
ncbi:MAG: YkgJ family cysteine cluster protein [Promethearchaeia archaeon]